MPQNTHIDLAARVAVDSLAERNQLDKRRLPVKRDRRNPPIVALVVRN